MKMPEKNEFLARSNATLGDLYNTMTDLPAIRLKDLEVNRTAFVIVDMINGFTREGALMSPRAEKLIPQIAKLSKACDKLKIAKVAFADCHTDASPEFDAYPQHCLQGSSEAEIVDELKKIGGYTLIPKNSTNGFLEEQFQTWLKDNQHVDTFLITGVCTDICVMQFATTLKTWFNKQNKKTRMIVPVNAVDTYDLGMHNGDLTNVMALYSMQINGIELVACVE